MSSPNRVSPYIEIANPAGRAPVLILADHSGREIPDELDRLGLSDDLLERHIAYDIGVAVLARRLAELLDAPAILDHCSRLVIDPNRRPGSPSSIPPVSDNCVVPGNQDVTRDEAERRIRRYFLPYHRTVARRLGQFQRQGIVPAVIAVHSFTPRMHGLDRPWHVGVLWRDDQRISAPVLEQLRHSEGLVIGDNQPYSGIEEFGYTVEFHCQRNLLPHVMFEVRQNEIATSEASLAWAERIAELLNLPLARPDLYRRYDGPRTPGKEGMAAWRAASRL